MPTNNTLELLTLLTKNNIENRKNIDNLSKRVSELVDVLQKPNEPVEEKYTPSSVGEKMLSRLISFLFSSKLQNQNKKIESKLDEQKQNLEAISKNSGIKEFRIDIITPTKLIPEQPVVQPEKKVIPFQSKKPELEKKVIPFRSNSRASINPDDNTLNSNILKDLINLQREQEIDNNYKDREEERRKTNILYPKLYNANIISFSENSLKSLKKLLQEVIPQESMVNGFGGLTNLTNLIPLVGGKVLPKLKPIVGKLGFPLTALMFGASVVEGAQDESIINASDPTKQKKDIKITDRIKSGLSKGISDFVFQIIDPVTINKLLNSSLGEAMIGASIPPFAIADSIEKIQEIIKPSISKKASELVSNTPQSLKTPIPISSQKEEESAIKQYIQTESGGKNIINKETYDAGYYQFNPVTVIDTLRKMGRETEYSSILPEIKFKGGNVSGSISSITKKGKEAIANLITNKSFEEQTKMFQTYIQPLKQSLMEKGKSLSFESIKTYGFGSSPKMIEAISDGISDPIIYGKEQTSKMISMPHFRQMMEYSGGDVIKYSGIKKWVETLKEEKFGKTNTPTKITKPINQSDEVTPNIKSSESLIKPTMNLDSTNNKGQITYAAASENRIMGETAAQGSSIINSPTSNTILNTYGGTRENRKLPMDPYNPNSKFLDRLFYA